MGGGIDGYLALLFFAAVIILPFVVLAAIAITAYVGSKFRGEGEPDSERAKRKRA